MSPHLPKVAPDDPAAPPPVARIAIVTDGSADVPSVERSAGPRAGVPWVVVPETWFAGDIEVSDPGDDSRELVRLVLSDIAPDPSEPRYDVFIDTFRQLRHVERVFAILPPDRVSLSATNAREAAGGFPNVRVIQAGVAGIGIGLLAVRAADMAAAGTPPEEVESWLRASCDAVRMLIVPDRFDPTGGQRTSSARLLAGRPMFHATPAGGFDRSRRLRSRRATIAAIERYLADNAPEDGHTWLALGHGDAAGAIDPFLDIIERIRPAAEVALVGRIGPRLVQQLGSRCVGAAWITEPGTQPEIAAAEHLDDGPADPVV